MMVKRNLVYDVGMHLGRDTAHYLNLGYRVVAIEADPELVEKGRERFREAIDSGDLTIVDNAVAAARGSIQFHVHETKEWSSLFSDRWSPEQTKYRTIEVPALPFDDILAANGTPYYIKVDIEGAEMHVLDGMARAGELPTYVSVELCDFALIEKLALLGYDGFIAVDQHGKAWSGPFGADRTEPWVSAAEVMNYTREKHRTDLASFWFDVHARLPERLRGAVEALPPPIVRATQFSEH